jgi:hypothetical protein
MVPGFHTIPGSRRIGNLQEALDNGVKNYADSAVIAGFAVDVILIL